MQKKKFPLWFGTILGVIVTSLCLFYPLDYYVMKPGSAYEIAQYLKVDDADKDDEGAFYMMTVTMVKASPITYVYAQFQEYYDILPIDEVRQEEEDDEEYEIRQTKMMTDSQFNALYNAYTYADLDYKVTYNGVYVLNIITDSAADGVLKSGDEIVEINGQIIERQEMLSQQIDQTKNGEIELVIKRNNKLLTKKVTLKEIPNTDGQIGLGVTYGESKSITTEPHVDMKADGIGGPSAGLMFTLEILNQILEEDLAKGYEVAGTGEMLENGQVGRIGGVEKKVVAANEAGMEIFFVPDDEVSEELKKKYPEYVSNAEAALKTAKKIGTTMKIVPVKTLQDALDYLDTLKEKH